MIMKKNIYRQPKLTTWHINAQENLMFNPGSNTSLPSNPVTPGVGVKEDVETDDNFWGPGAFES